MESEPERVVRKLSYRKLAMPKVGELSAQSKNSTNLIVRCANCEKTALIPNWVFITCPPESIAMYLDWYLVKSSGKFYCSVECAHQLNEQRENPDEIQQNPSNWSYCSAEN